jgi:hypothetical protein
LAYTNRNPNPKPNPNPTEGEKMDIVGESEGKEEKDGKEGKEGKKGEEGGEEGEGGGAIELVTLKDLTALANRLTVTYTANTQFVFLRQLLSILTQYHNEINDWVDKTQLLLPQR